MRVEGGGGVEAAAIGSARQLSVGEAQCYSDLDGIRRVKLDNGLWQIPKSPYVVFRVRGFWGQLYGESKTQKICGWKEARDGRAELTEVG